MVLAAPLSLTGIPAPSYRPSTTDGRFASTRPLDLILQTPLLSMMAQDYDVAIVGAGPAGLFAARELAGRRRVVVVDEGRGIPDRSCPMEAFALCRHCQPCGILCGVGGAGTFSDGILNLRPDVGGDLQALTGSGDAAWALVAEVDRAFVGYGAPAQLIDPPRFEVEALERRAASVGARFIEIRQRHIGTDRAPAVMGAFERELRSKGVDFMLRTRVTDLIVEGGRCAGVRTDAGEIRAGAVLAAPGRVGAGWLREMVGRYGIRAHHGPLDLGVRVEVPAVTMDPVTKINRDPKFHIRTRSYDDFVRTFCCNDRGYVVKEDHGDFVATNGHSRTDKSSENTNFAFLVQISLTEPVQDTTEYGRYIARMATNIGGGKPILQRMGDLRRGRRSTADRIRRSRVPPTLTDVTPGDISMALPHRVVVDIIEGLEILDKIIPGVAADSTLLYAPEVKFYGMRIEVGRDMQTSLPGLYAAGDGAGLSRDIVKAAATGILAARGILGEP